MYTRFFYLSERMLHADSVYINNQLEKLAVKTKDGSATYKTWSNIALNLMKLGDVDSSLKILTSQYITHPEEYNIVANLGTAYELKGELDSALKYISKGLQINPKSHGGSEWVHVKILEAKKKEKQYRNWLESNPIIKMGELADRIDTSKLRQSIRSINHQLNYQIRTRVPFTPAPNQTIAILLLSLGDFNFKYGTYEDALLAYGYAVQFQKTPYLQRKTKDKITELNKKRTTSGIQHEIPRPLIRAMQRSHLSPELLLLGLDDLAQKLDSIHFAELEQVDSVNVLTNQLDSLKRESIKQNEQKEVQLKETENSKYFYLLFGLIIGFVFSLFLIKRKRK